MDTEKIKQRLLAKRLIDPETNCWLWTGFTHRGYGRMRVDGPSYRVHRVSAAVFLDFDLQNPLSVCHRCDIPSCFNPEHLWIGTHEDNMHDMANKKRATKLKGSQCGNSKLTEDYVQEILILLSQGYTLKQIGARFDISYSVVSDIKLNKIWKHVPR